MFVCNTSKGGQVFIKLALALAKVEEIERIKESLNEISTVPDPATSTSPIQSPGANVIKLFSFITDNEA